MRDAFPLADRRVWHGVLSVIFLLGVAVRVGLWHELSDHPIMRQQEWPRTQAANWMRLASQMSVGDWTLAQGTVRVSRAMGEARPPAFWDRTSARRLPRGAAALYLLGFSVHATGTHVLFTVLTIVAGGFACAAGAAASARMAGRAAGILAGVLLAANMNLAIAGLRIGPWAWEAAALAAILLCGIRAWQDRRNPAEWLLLGITIACGIWLRPAFWWCVPVAGIALWRAKERLFSPCLGALLLPVVLGAGALAARNISVDASPAPLVGNPAWDLARHWNPDALLHPSVPAELGPYSAAKGDPLRLAALMLTDARTVRALPRLALKQLRFVLGAREEPEDLAYDYVRRRSDWLRTATLGSDATVALAIGGVLFLLWRRRGKTGTEGTGVGVLGCSVGVLVVCGAAFAPMGEDRAALHVAGACIAAIAMADALAARRESPLAAWTWLLLCWGALAWLWIDDVARGPRFRWDEFARSEYLLEREGRVDEADWELLDFTAREQMDRAFDIQDREWERRISPGS